MRNWLCVVIALLILCAACHSAQITAVQKIVQRARLEVERGVVYNSDYVTIKFPGGDVPSNQGACTDVIVRALRAAGYDLQALIATDKRRAPKGTYPNRRIDTNIDHRRVTNHIPFLKRYGQRLTTSLSMEKLPEWEAGDLVYMDLGGGLLHCGVVSDVRTASGRPFLIHNCGPTAREEDFLGQDDIKVLYHFRFPIPKDNILTSQATAPGFVV